MVVSEKVRKFELLAFELVNQCTTQWRCYTLYGECKRNYSHATLISEILKMEINMRNWYVVQERRSGVRRSRARKARRADG
jgi:hypothetical protein